jgi:hypothetical protein
MNGTQDREAPKVIRPGSPGDLLALVPGLLGFVPEQSLVVIGVTGPRHRIRVTLRYDLPEPDDIRAVEQIAEHAMTVLAQAGTDMVFAVIYGTDEGGALVAAVLRAQYSVPVRDVLRVQGNRYWSYACADEQCCPADGTPFETDVPDEFGPVLAGRQALAEQVAPVTGIRRGQMFQAVEAEVGRVGAMPRRAIQVALNATRLAIASYRADEEFGTDAELATILVGLRHLWVRDDAWSRLDPDHCEAHIKLWTDLTRIAPPGFVAAPASLLAFCAWQVGNGALVNVALDRALADEPTYSMALLLRQVITSGAPPSLARLPMSPEEVAASYDER